MAVIDAVVTDYAKSLWPRMLGGIMTPDVVEGGYFQVGEGGWEVDPLTSLRVPRDPAAHVDKIRLDIDEDQYRSAGTKRYDVGETLGYFQKTLLAGKVTWSVTSPKVMRVTCTLDTFEYNQKNDGTLIYDVGGGTELLNPEFWEIGVFDTGGHMVAYGTFDKQIKTVLAAKNNVVRIMFGA